MIFSWKDPASAQLTVGQNGKAGFIWRCSGALSKRKEHRFLEPSLGLTAPGRENHFVPLTAIPSPLQEELR